ncbi:hypothetical protein [Bacillus methanolicus]|uniref:hypothetical protein n=1 Tax=Bacillus methanolicus TaxID=1471 RepID=UPI002380BEA2|nr:hypothetical protein [Bacillus methanolicus]
MKDEWQKLIEDLQNQGLKPNDVKKIILVYRMAKKIDEELEGYFDDNTSKGSF